MGVCKITLLVFNIGLHMVFQVKSDCELSLNKPPDFGSPQPIFLQNDEFLAASDAGVIFVKQSETITVTCSGNNRFIVLGNATTTLNTADGKCLSNRTFNIGEWVGPFKDIKCDKSPILSTNKTGITCYTGSQLIRVGYWVSDAFKQLFELCFNNEVLTTPYVHHVIGPSNVYTQYGKRPNFRDPGHFGNTRIAKLYGLRNQKDQINKILGPDMDKKYLTKNQVLTRGHLAPRADFLLRSGQTATFIYANAAPQWRRGNQGDWAALEDSLRRRVKVRGRSVELYTGTHGVSTLRDATGQPREIYLGTDDNNNHIVPVPMYYYKVIYDPEEKSAVAFVSINSSYHNSTEIAELTFCEDLCRDNPAYRWVTWRDDGTTSFCCSFQEFNKTIDHLKHLQVDRPFE